MVSVLDSVKFAYVLPLFTVRVMLSVFSKSPSKTSGYGLLSALVIAQAAFTLPAFAQTAVTTTPAAAPAVTTTTTTTTTAPPAATADDVLKKIEESDTAMPELPPANTTSVVTTTTAAPPQTGLVPATPAVATTTTVTDGGLVPIVPAMPASPTPAEDLFFDAQSLSPGSSTGMGAQGTSVVRTVNPRTEPASKLVIVKKEYEPGSRQAQMVSAQRAMMLGRYDAALALYDRLHEKNKKDPNIMLGRAMAMQKLGQTDAAINTYEEVLDLQPNNEEAQINMLGLMGQKYPAVALQRLLDLQERQPNNVTLLGQIAVVQAKLGYYDDAAKYLGMAASLEPNNPSHYYNMAVIADRAGNKKDAIRFYEKTLEIDAIYSGGGAIPRDSVFDRLAQLR